MAKDSKQYIATLEREALTNQEALARALHEREEALCNLRAAERNAQSYEAAINTLHEREKNFAQQRRVEVEALKATITRLRTVAHVLIDEVAMSNGERGGGVSPNDLRIPLTMLTPAERVDRIKRQAD